MKYKRKRLQHGMVSPRYFSPAASQVGLNRRNPHQLRHPSDSSEMNYADNEADNQSITDSDASFMENFESDPGNHLQLNRRPPMDRLPPLPSCEAISLHRGPGSRLFYSAANLESNPLLSGSIDMSIPTPANARKQRFHPNQYLVDYQLGSDSADSTSSEVRRYTSNQQLRGTPFGSSKNHERLDLSSLSEEDSDDVTTGMTSSHRSHRRATEPLHLPSSTAKPPSGKRSSKTRNKKSYTKHRNQDRSHREQRKPLLTIRTLSEENGVEDRKYVIEDSNQDDANQLEELDEIHNTDVVTTETESSPKESPVNVEEVSANADDSTKEPSTQEHE